MCGRRAAVLGASPGAGRQRVAARGAKAAEKQRRNNEKVKSLHES